MLSVIGKDNTGTDSDNIIFTIKNKTLYVPVVTFSAKDIEKLSKILQPGFKSTPSRYRAKF